jgi:hypothetical protein
MSDLFEGPLSIPATTVLLHLTWLRAAALVSTALVTQFPTYQSWEQLMDDPDARRDLERFVLILEEIRSVTALGGEYDIAAAEAAGDRRAHALEALATFAKRLEVDPEDLLSVLLHA